MKKLLGILGTITIAGSGMAGLVGNAPTKKEINYLQTNNSENLSRVKRWNPIDWTIQAGKDVGNAVATGAKTVATVVVGAEAAADNSE